MHPETVPGGASGFISSWLPLRGQQKSESSGSTTGFCFLQGQHPDLWALKHQPREEKAGLEQRPFMATPKGCAEAAMGMDYWEFPVEVAISFSTVKIPTQPL